MWGMAACSGFDDSESLGSLQRAIDLESFTAKVQRKLRSFLAPRRP
jgi:hypothetical protein